jgi:hypothetical protein
LSFHFLNFFDLTGGYFDSTDRPLMQSQSATNAENCKYFCLNDKVLICCDIGNPYLGKLAKPTQGPFKIIIVQQLPINGTILIQ